MIGLRGGRLLLNVFLLNIVKDLKYDRIQLDVKNGKIRLWNKGLPFNKIHVVGLGCNGKGDLVVLIVDGRQNESIGVTYSQPADLMIKEGIVMVELVQQGVMFLFM